MDLKTSFRNRDMVGVQESALSDEQKNIAVITIDGNVIGGYKSYSFVRVKEYVKEPTRSQNGQIANLDSYTTFITPKVRIKFNALSVDGYRMLMNLILSKNEFYVGCYDFTLTDQNHPNGRWVHQNMYFYPNDYPEIFQYDLDVLAVLNYEIELIGTNTNNENIVVTLNSNYPDGTELLYNIPNAFQNEQVAIVYPTSVFDADKEIIVDSTTYMFSHWNTKADESGVSIFDNSEASFGEDTILYAIWTTGMETVNFSYQIGGLTNSFDVEYLAETTLTNNNLPSQNSIVMGGEIVGESNPPITYNFDGWYIDSAFTTSAVGKSLTELTQPYKIYGKFVVAV